MRIDPLLTHSPVTGAVRYLTESLLAEVYLAPRAEAPDMMRLLEGRAGPWAASLAAAPTETVRAVEAGLDRVMRATRSLDPSEIEPERLAACRARDHLAALVELWRDLGTLPGGLATVAHVLGSEAEHALEPLPLVLPVNCAHADPVEVALADRLMAHHGAVKGVQSAISRDATAQGALGNIQQSLGRPAAPGTADDAVRIYALRDPREEAEFAAALAQRMLDTGVVARDAEIGVLLPDDPAYAAALGEAFERVGLALSGAPDAELARDVAGEVLSLLLTLMQGPAPRTALASLYTAPGMPWREEAGRQMAREVIDRGYSRTARTMDGAARELLDALRPADTPEQLAGRLGAIAGAAPLLDLHPRLQPLRPILDTGLDWAALHRLAAPLRQAVDGPPKTVEGVSVFGEAALPWRPVRQLIVLGLAGRHWPRPVGTDPFFTESELVQLREATGLDMPGRGRRMARGLELFRRQLCAATEGLTLTVPAVDLRGDRLSPGTGLALIAHLTGAKDAEAAVSELRAMPPADWPVATEAMPPARNGGVAQRPADGVVALGTNLLRLGEEDDARPAPHSPSRLETLLVSPLAWLLDELKARDTLWAPETTDVMTLGTILHQVLEDCFPVGPDVPGEAELEQVVPGALEAAIARHAPWLGGPAWEVERQSLHREALDAALRWARFLRDAGAEVLHNEVSLFGEHDGLALGGKADCILRVPDGRILVVDHKRSSSRGRLVRMQKGWDLQVALYRAMIRNPAEETALTRLVAEGARVATAYHTLLDGRVLTDADGAGIPGTRGAGDDPSASALEHLSELLAEVGGGVVRLNRADDLKTFEKERGITAYALKDNAFVASFSMPEEAE